MNKQQEIFDTLFKVAVAVEPVSHAKVASCIVYRNRIVAIGVNKKKSHPFQLKYANHPKAIYLHAETAALKRSLHTIPVTWLPKCSLFVLRVKCPQFREFPYSDWAPAVAKPCKSCQKAIVEFKIKDVFFSTGETCFDSGRPEIGRIVLS
jgi:deoxycytidylate deaminase